MSFGKGDVPNAPSFMPQQEGFRIGATESEAASSDAFNLGRGKLDDQTNYGAVSGNVGNIYLNAANQARDWGMKQFNEVWPYAKNYLSSQQSLSTLAGENASDAVVAARQQRQQASDTYNRYMQSFAPVEDRFARSALEYNDPARAAQASAAAKGDVTAAYAADWQKQQQELESHGIDPSQGRYAGAQLTAGLSQSAATAAAGTKARRESEKTGLDLMKSAIDVGQKLPVASVNQMAGASTGAAYGLKAGEYGGTGIPSATGLLGAGSQAAGTPYQFATLSNPYTTLSGQFGSTGGQLYGTGVSALGNITNAAIGSSQANTAGFNAQMQAFNAQEAQNAAFWKSIGQIGSLALAPVTGGGSLIGNAVTSAFPETFGAGWGSTNLG